MSKSPIGTQVTPVGQYGGHCIIACVPWDATSVSPTRRKMSSLPTKRSRPGANLSLLVGRKIARTRSRCWTALRSIVGWRSESRAGTLTSVGRSRSVIEGTVGTLMARRPTRTRPSGFREWPGTETTAACWFSAISFPTSSARAARSTGPRATGSRMSDAGYGPSSATGNTDDTISCGLNMAAIRQGIKRIGAGDCRPARVP
jgi:hypothetical protein